MYLAFIFVPVLFDLDIYFIMKTCLAFIFLVLLKMYLLDLVFCSIKI